MLVQTELAVVTCGSCHMMFAVPAEFDTRRRTDHKRFHCPAGCAILYHGKSDLDRANDALAREKHLREQAEASAASRALALANEQEETRRIARRLSATQGVVTRHKRKITKGQCPCCTTTFKNLAAHMKRSHPHWDPAKEAEAQS